METKKFLEAHNGLSALLIERSDKWDGIWISSLTHAASHGLPDNELVPLMERVDLVREVKGVSKKPIIVDVDTLGDIRHTPHYVKAFRDAGAYAITIEDKKYPKENSLLEDGRYSLEHIDNFCEKIIKAKENSGPMKVITRLESLIAKHSIYEALVRAEAYEKAGADMILIHSKQKVSCDEVMEFATKFREKSNLPLVAIPTTYNLPEKHPFAITIKANHLLRASLRAMQEYIDGKSNLASVEEIFNLIGK